MKKSFEAPVLDVVRFDEKNDIITCSGGIIPPDPPHPQHPVHPVHPESPMPPMPPHPHGPHHP